MLRIVTCLCFIALLTSCSASTVEEQKESLIGPRVSVLTHDAKLTTSSNKQTAKITLPRPFINGNWKQAGGISNHSMQHLLLTSGTSLLWRKDFGEGSNSENYLITEPIVYKGTVFTLDVEARVCAFDLATGKKLWTRRVASQSEQDDSTAIKGAGLAISHGKLIITTGFADVIAIDINRMGEIWRYKADAPFRSAPTIEDERIFVQTITDKLISLNLSDGKELWSYQASGEKTILLGCASPAVDKGVLIAAFSDGEIKAFKSDTGSLLWANALTSINNKARSSEINSITARPVIENGVVYAIGHNNLMAAIDIRTSRRIWTQEIGGLNQPYLAGKYIYAINNDNELVAMSAKTGDVLWIRKLPKYADEAAKRNAILFYGPVLASNKLIISASNGYTYFVNPYNGKIIYQNMIARELNSAPIIAEDTLLFTSANAKILAYK